VNVLPGLLIALACLAFCRFAFLVSSWSQKDGEEISGWRLRAINDDLAVAGKGAAALSILKDVDEDPDSRERRVVMRLPSRLRARVELALYRSESSVGIFRLLLLASLLFVVGAYVGFELFYRPWLALVLGGVGAVIPFSVLRWRARKTIAQFEADFPEALSLVARSLRGGHALQRSLRLVADELDGPVAREFRLVAEEVSLGRDLGAVLDRLGTRVGLSDVHLFTSGVLIQREFGGNLAEIVDKLANMIRERFKFHAKVRAMTSMNRSSAFILLCVPVVFVGLMAMTNREFVTPLWTTEDGQLVGVAAAALALGGYGAARRIANVQS